MLTQGPEGPAPAGDIVGTVYKDSSGGFVTLSAPDVLTLRPTRHSLGQDISEPGPRIDPAQEDLAGYVRRCLREVLSQGRQPPHRE